jgi:AraC-like DNA-binding protein
MRASPPAPRRAARGPIAPIRYAPPSGYGLDLEVYSTGELRRRARTVDLGGIERLQFHFIVGVRAGRYRHMVDFETHACTAGSVLHMRPGQVHRWGALDGWEGWVLLFRPELLESGSATAQTGELELVRAIEALPVHLRTTGSAQDAVIEAFSRMTADTTLAGPATALHALLRSQLHALLIRLALAGSRKAHAPTAEPAVLQRFRRFRTTVEREHARWHSVAQYAKHLGCSEKSLTRATLEAADVNAKAFLVNRIVLEARRLLAHTALPVAAVGDQLGFAEATNFVKFFRRETGMPPGAFRAGQRAAGSAAHAQARPRSTSAPARTRRRG